MALPTFASLQVPLTGLTAIRNALLDLWRQALAYLGPLEAVATPSGSKLIITEATGPWITSMVATFARNTAPTGWLKCNGAAVSRTTFADLFAAIGTTFGVGDGSTTFNVPEMRGEWARGWDDARGVDTGRVFGSAQLDAFQGHMHMVRESVKIAGATDQDYTAGGAVNIPTRTAFANQTVFTAAEALANATNGTPRVASETRPRNIALLYCIKT